MNYQTCPPPSVWNSDIVNKFADTLDRQCSHGFRIETVPFDGLRHMERNPSTLNLKGEVKIRAAENRIRLQNFAAQIFDILVDRFQNRDSLGVLEFVFVHVDLGNVVSIRVIRSDRQNPVHTGQHDKYHHGSHSF